MTPRIILKGTQPVDGPATVEIAVNRQGAFMLIEFLAQLLQKPMSAGWEAKLNVGVGDVIRIKLEDDVAPSLKS